MKFFFLLIFFCFLSNGFSSELDDWMLEEKRKIVSQEKMDVLPKYQFLTQSDLSDSAPQKNEVVLPPVTSPPMISSLYVQFHYMDVKSIQSELLPTSSGLMSKKGALLFDTASNSLLFYDEPFFVNRMRAWVKKIDQPPQQILIKTRIVNVDSSSLKNLGVRFENINMPVAVQHLGYSFDVQLDALVKQGRAEIISNPELITLNHQKAIIESGEDIPYQEQTRKGATAVVFKKAVMRLSVTPEIWPHRVVRLLLEINQDKVSALFVNGVPAIRTQHLLTQAFVKNRSTLVMGGISEQLERSDNEGVHGLQNVPLLGVLFRHHHSHHEQRELIIFVTPVVIS